MIKIGEVSETSYANYTIDGQEYFATSNILSFGEKKYQELKNCNIMQPNVEYAEIIDGDLFHSENQDIDLTFHILMAHDLRPFLFGRGGLVLDAKPLSLRRSQFIVENGEIIILSEAKLVAFEKEATSFKKRMDCQDIEHFQRIVDRSRAHERHYDDTEIDKPPHKTRKSLRKWLCKILKLK
jgi:hypothetical protein